MRCLLRWGVSSLLALSCAAVEAQQRPRPISDAAERIAAETWPVERDRPTEDGVTIFRSGTEADVEAFKLPPPWLDDQRMGPRMNGSAAHRERLMMVTPEAFRGSTLYPVGVGVDPAAIVNGITSAWRKQQERRVRARIQREVDALTSVTDDPAPGN